MLTLRTKIKGDPLGQHIYIRYIDDLRTYVYLTKRFKKTLENEVNISFLFPVFFVLFFVFCY